MQRAEIVVRGQRIDYWTAGAGEPVVLVHGLAGAMRWWRRNVPPLAAHRTVYLLNLPGFGAFCRRGLRFALSEAAGWLGLWIKAMGIAPCHLVAHSMGGHIVVQLAAREPSPVNRLVLVAPALVAGRRRLASYPLALVCAALAMSPSFLPILALDTRIAGPQTLLQAARSLLSDDIQELLQRIVAPTLLIWGERDALVPPSLGPLLRTELPDARLLLLPGAGHVAQYDRPVQFNAATLAFLDGRSVGIGRTDAQCQDGASPAELGDRTGAPSPLDAVRNGQTTSTSRFGWL
jgi:pimeloyl-ACP methyl ester carboxylesterase